MNDTPETQTDPVTSEPVQAEAPPAPAVTLCPYCGYANTATDKCASCGGLFEPLSLKATQIAMGPWFIRDKAQPYRPGCSFETLCKMVEAGRIKPTTVVRGPTTQQFWSVARNVPGLAHRLGFCHQCNTTVSPSDAACPACGAQFESPTQRDQLGLLYPTAAQAKAAGKKLEAEVNAATLGVPTSTVDAAPSPETETGAPSASGESLGAAFEEAPSFALNLPPATGPAVTPVAAPARPDTPLAPPMSDVAAPPPAAEPAGFNNVWLAVIAANVVLALVVALVLFLLATGEVQL